MDSIQFCYKYAFIAGIVGICFLLSWRATEWAAGLYLGLATKLSVVLHQFVFGAGLYRVWCLNIMFSSNEASITPASHVTTLASDCSGSDFVCNGTIDNLASFSSISAMGIRLGICSCGLCSYPNLGYKSRQLPTPRPGLVGFASARNICLCMGSFGLLGLVQTVTSLALVHVCKSVWAVGCGRICWLARCSDSSLRPVVAVTDATELKAVIM